MVYRDPSHVPLAWVLQLIQDIIESDPNQLYIIDPIPNLHWLLCNDHLIKKDCTQEMNEFEQRVCVAERICAPGYLRDGMLSGSQERELEGIILSQISHMCTNLPLSLVSCW